MNSSVYFVSFSHHSNPLKPPTLQISYLVQISAVQKQSSPPQIQISSPDFDCQLLFSQFRPIFCLPQIDRVYLPTTLLSLQLWPNYILHYYLFLLYETLRENNVLLLFCFFDFFGLNLQENEFVHWRFQNIWMNHFSKYLSRVCTDSLEFLSLKSSHFYKFCWSSQMTSMLILIIFLGFRDNSSFQKFKVQH